MPAFRAKPVVIEAYRTGESLIVETLEGDMRAQIGDWIIKGTKGEYYPCKDDVFRKKYEPVDAEGVRALAAPIPGQVEEECSIIPFPA